jgi:hypothetical protein
MARREPQRWSRNLRNEAEGYARWLTHHGFNREDTLNKLVDKFRGIPVSQLEDIWEQGAAQKRAADKFNKSQPPRPVPESDIPINPDLPSRYRYTVIARYLCPPGGTPYEIQTVVDSDEKLRRGTLFTTIYEMGTALPTSRQWSPGLPEDCDENWLNKVTVLGIERKN